MNFPHVYSASANAQSEGLVSIRSEGLPSLNSAPPSQFGGPGDQWSPEDLLVASVADCYVLSFRAIARMSKFDFIELACSVEGTLDKVERDTQFTAFKVKARLTISSDADEARAQRLLEKAEATCLITNSLKAHPELETEIVQA